MLQFYLSPSVVFPGLVWLIGGVVTPIERDTPSAFAGSHVSSSVSYDFLLSHSSLRRLRAGLWLGLVVGVGLPLLTATASDRVQQSQSVQPQSEADKRLAVDRLIESNQQSHSVPRILSTSTFELVGKLEGVSASRGSGGFWGFAVMSVGDNEEYAFGCSSQSELYIRIHKKDASLLDGMKAMKKGALVTLYIRDRDLDFFQRCSRGSRCDGAICPIGIEFN